jgi:hypothetical protein
MCYSAASHDGPLKGAVGRGYDPIGQDYAVDRSPRDKTDKIRRAHITEDIIATPSY